MGKVGLLTPALAAAAAVALFCAPGCAEPGQGINSSDSREVIASVNELAARGSEEDVVQIELATISTDAHVAAEAVRGLGSIRCAEAVAALKRVAVEEKRPEVREEVAYQLGLQREEAPIEVLEQLLQRDASPRVRAAAASSLARLRVLEDIPLLVDVAERETDVFVQSRAVSAVESMIGLKVGYDVRAPAPERRSAVRRLRGVALVAGAALAPQDARREGGS
jgi:HEAT repeat protein